MLSLVDLHSHSTASDGQDSPTELIHKALSRGVRVLALTDHDTLSGLEEASQAAVGTDLNFIRGVELEIEWPHVGEFHLLGLNLGTNTEMLEEALILQRSYRTERNRQIVAMMNAQGMTMNYEEIVEENPGAVIGRPHIATHLLNAGHVKHYQQAFDNYLAYGRPFYLPKRALPLNYATKILHDCGGIAVVAHPMSLCLSWKNMEMRVPEFRDAGVDGLEAYHSTCSPLHCEHLAKIAMDNRMCISGGSDYHGENTKKLGMLGYYNHGKNKIPQDVLEIFKQKNRW